MACRLKNAQGGEDKSWQDLRVASFSDAGLVPEITLTVTKLE